MAKKSKDEMQREQMLKQAAITFSLEGLNEDFMAVLDKKLHHIQHCFKETCQLLVAAINSNSEEVSNSLLKKDHAFRKLLDHYTFEIIKTDEILSEVLEEMLVQEDDLKAQQEG